VAHICWSHALPFQVSSLFILPSHFPSCLVSYHTALLSPSSCHHHPHVIVIAPAPHHLCIYMQHLHHASVKRNSSYSTYSILFLTYTSYFGGTKGISRNKMNYFFLMHLHIHTLAHSLFHLSASFPFMHVLRMVCF